MSHIALLEAHYDTLARNFSLRRTDDYAALVVPSGNDSEPIHRWFHVKEAYSHDLLSRVLKDYCVLPADKLTILDPFCGSGTTAVSAARLVVEGAVGEVNVNAIECNPYLHLLTTVKAHAAANPIVGFETFAAVVIARAASEGQQGPAPALTTFHHPFYFSPEALFELAAIRDAIRDLAADTDPVLVNLARVCLAAAVEPCSFLRRDGRTLRFTPGKRITRPMEQFSSNAEMMCDDFSGRALANYSAKIDLGDSRKIDKLDVAPNVGAVVFSPPYPNNIDYTEVYKLENWMLGFVRDEREFFQLRHRTLRSHGSLLWHDSYDYENAPYADQVQSLLQPLLDSIPHNRYTRARRQLVRGYFDDMLTVLRSAAQVLMPGGLLACVVGNSMHGRRDEPLLIASDLIFSALCEVVGLQVQCVEVARVPSRRRSDSKHLRESIVVARKTGT